MQSTHLSVLAAVLISLPAQAQAPNPQPSGSPVPAARPSARPTKDDKDAAKKDVQCDDHGVPKKLCARCNPKLEPVFKAKGDWCEEHKRPESQCVLCHPDLGKKGVK